MFRFFTENMAAGSSRIILKGTDAHHIKDVLRLRTGDEISVCGQDGTEYLCDIVSFGDGEVTARIHDMRRPATELDAAITLYQCLPKSGKMDRIIQASVELGAAKIVPVLSERTVARPDPARIESRLSRWRAIAKSAAEQSGRSVIPQVGSPLEFPEALKDAAGCDIKLMPYENETDRKKSGEIVSSVPADSSIAVLIGPEGGFANHEAREAKEAGFSCITLGRRILRTETAGPAILSILMFQIESRG